MDESGQIKFTQIQWLYVP